MRAPLRFEGKVAVVTGAGSGLGRAYAQGIAARGGKVVVNDLGVSVEGRGADKSAAQTVVDEILAAGGAAIANFDSVATPEGGAAITQSALDHYGRIDAVIANAGILRDRSFTKMTVDELDRVLDVHLRGTVFTVQPAFRWMRENGGGAIVTTTSPSGLFGTFGQANYAAAKMGIAGLTGVLALEGAKAGIRANIIAPSAATRMAATVGVGTEDPGTDHLSPDWVASVVLALIHDSCPANGEIFTAGGGWVGRAIMALTPGATLAACTPEAVVDQWTQIRDTRNLRLPHDAGDYWAMIQTAFARSFA